MLITQFYTLRSTANTGEGSWTVDVELNPHHNLYAGHFPGNPILPGVISLQIIKECLGQLMDSSFRYAQVNSCKFLSAINPVQTPRLHIVLTTKPLEDDQLLLTAEGTNGTTDFIKLKATLTTK